MLQVALMVASIHLALRIVAVRTDHVALTPVALYFISISYLGLAIIILAIRGYDPEASFTVFVTLFVIFILPVFVMFWTVLYRGLHLAPWKAFASFLLFVTMFLAYGNILNLVIQELDRQLS